MSMYNSNQIVPCHLGCRHNLTLGQMVFPDINFIAAQFGTKATLLTGEQIKKYACCTVHQKRFANRNIKLYPHTAVVNFIRINIPEEALLKCIKCSDELLARDADTPDLESIAAYLGKPKVTDEDEIVAHPPAPAPRQGSDLNAALLYFRTLYTGTSFRLGGQRRDPEPPKQPSRKERRVAKALEKQQRTNQVVLAAARSGLNSVELVDRAIQKNLPIEVIANRAIASQRMHKGKIAKRMQQTKTERSDANAA